MKLLLENWRKYLNEEEYSITPEQNQALKKIYIIISKFVVEIKNTLEQNPEKAIYELQRDGLIKPEDYGFVYRGGKYLLTDESLFNELPPIEPKSMAVLLYRDGKPGASFKITNHRHRGATMKISGLLSADILTIKSFIQHELQHIFTQEHMGAMGAGSLADDEMEKINYIFDEGELRAHTKQYAYLYHKLFPEEENFNPDKFVDEISNRNIGVGRGPAILYQKTLLEPHTKELGGVQNIKKMNDKAVKYTQYYLTLFKRKENETSI